MTGQESFTLTAPHGGDLMLMSVYHAPMPVVLSVRVDGDVIAAHSLPGMPGLFVVVPTRISGRDRSGTVTVTIDYSSADQVVTPYWHGIFAAAPLTTGPVSVQFAQAGVGVEPQITHTGDILTVELSWLNAGEATGDYRRFVHVYGQLDQPPVIQDDAYPGDGAFPPSILPRGVTSEQVVLDLAALPAGRYTVAIGLYSPLDGARATPSVACCWSVESDRVLVGEVVIGDDG